MKKTKKKKKKAREANTFYFLKGILPTLDRIMVTRKKKSHYNARKGIFKSFRPKFSFGKKFFN